MMGRHQYITEDEYEVNLKDFEPQPGMNCCSRNPTDSFTKGEVQLCRGGGGVGFNLDGWISNNNQTRSGVYVAAPNDR